MGRCEGRMGRKLELPSYKAERPEKSLSNSHLGGWFKGGDSQPLQCSACKRKMSLNQEGSV